MDFESVSLMGILLFVAVLAVVLRRLYGRPRVRIAPDRSIFITATTGAKLLQNAEDAAASGDYRRAFALLEEARAAYRSAAGPSLIAELTNLYAHEAGFRNKYGDPRGALIAARRAIAMADATPEPRTDDQAVNIPIALGLLHSEEAVILHTLGEDEAALRAAERAVGLLRPAAAQRPDRHTPLLARSISCMALGRYGLGDLPLAAALATEAVDLVCDHRGPALTQMSCHIVQARVLVKIDPAAGVRSAALALEIARQRSADEPLVIGIVTALLARCLLAAGDHGRALRAADIAEHLLRGIATPRARRQRAVAQSTRAAALAGLGRRDEAVASADRTLEIISGEHDEPWNRETVTRAAEARALALSSASTAVDTIPPRRDES